MGVPSEYYGGEGPGCCIDTSSIPGEGQGCDITNDCGDGLVCIANMCSPQWMQDTFSQTQAVSIPEAGVISDAMQVSCLATVPVDVRLDLHIEHPNPSELKIWITDPTEDITTVLFDHGAVDGTTLELTDQMVGHTGDIEVNAPWTLTIEDDVSGQGGTLVEWSLDISSRYD